MKKNLVYANKIMHDLCKKDKRISPITLKDLDLFNSFFQKEKHTYGNSWIYVTQGMYGIGPEGLGYKYYDGKNLSAIGAYPKIEQPDIHVFYWVRPMGKGMMRTINTFAHSLLQKDNLPTYVKKIFPEQFDYLYKKGFKDTTQFPWHSSCPSEDDTYPELIFDRNKTLNLAKELTRARSLKRIYLHAKHFEESNKIRIISDTFNKNAWKLTQHFFKSQLDETKIFLSSENDYYNPIFNNPIRKTLLRNLIVINNMPIGYYICEYNKQNFLSVYAFIILRDVMNVNGLVDYLLLYLFKTTKAKYLNLGGSEDKGIYNFKLKYQPEQSIAMRWASLY